MLDTLNGFAKDLEQIEAHLHARPELSFAERETTAYIVSHMEALGLERIELGMETGAVFRLRCKDKKGPTVGLRADIDAIRQQEAVERPDRSQNGGCMHACGHDVHTTGLLGAAMALCALRESLRGDVVFLFQPAEETLRGAKAMIGAGLFTKAPMDMLFGLHNLPGAPLGTVGVKEGPLMADKVDFVIEVYGRGGHGSTPEKCEDPLVAACALVGALQTVVSRNTAPMDAAVLSVCSIHGGTEENLIVDKIRMTGSLRTLSAAVRDRALARMREIVESGAAAYGCRAKLETEHICEGLCNGAQMEAIARRAADAARGAENIFTPTPSLGSEDFSAYGAHVPSFFYFLGSGEPEKAADNPPWHKPDFRCAPGTALASARLLTASVLTAQGIL